MLRACKLILLILVSFGLKAQTQLPVGLPNPNAPNNYSKQGYLQADKGFIFTERDTFCAKYPTLIKHLNQTFYYTNGGCTAWYPLVTTNNYSVINIINNNTVAVCSFGTNLCDTFITSVDAQLVTITSDTTILVCDTLGTCETFTVPHPIIQSNDWHVTGNFGTDSVNNFLGTTDNRPLIIRTNSTPKAKIHTTGEFVLSQGLTINPNLLSTTAGIDRFIAANNTSSVGMVGVAATALTAGRPSFKGVRSRGTVASPTAVVNGDEIVSFLAAPFDGTSSIVTARMTAVVNGLVATGSIPTDLVWTAGNLPQPNNGTQYEKMRLRSTGSLNLSQYGDGLFTGTPTYDAAFDANGNLIEIATGGGSNKVDSITVNYGITTDTSLYWVNGTSYLHTYIDHEEQRIIGGIVTWVSGLTYQITPAIYWINNVRYTSVAETVTLDAADDDSTRFDALVLDTSGTFVAVKGTLGSGSPPSADPATQFYRTFAEVAPTATEPTGLSIETIYDENTGAPEWPGTSTIPSINLDNLVTPYHLTKSTSTTAWANNQTIAYTRTSATDLSTKSILSFFIRLNGVVANNANIQVRFYNGNTAVSNAVTLGAAHGFVKTTTGSYQPIAMALSSFVFTSQIVTNLRFTFTGANTTGFRIDWITLQGGISNNNIPYVTRVFRKSGTDSVFYTIDGANIFAFIDSTGGGISLDNIGSGYRILANNKAGIKTLFGSSTVGIDSSSNANGLTIKADTSILATQYDLTQISSGVTLNNAGAGYRALITNATEIRSFNHDPTLSIDSLTSGELTFKVDTSEIATQYDLTQISTGTTSEQLQIASGSLDVTFTSVPASYDDYLIFRNGVLNESTTDYTTSGDTVTFVSGGLITGDRVVMRRTK